MFGVVCVCCIFWVKWWWFIKDVWISLIVLKCMRCGGFFFLSWLWCVVLMVRFVLMWYVYFEWLSLMIFFFVLFLMVRICCVIIILMLSVIKRFWVGWIFLVLVFFVLLMVMILSWYVLLMIRLKVIFVFLCVCVILVVMRLILLLIRRIICCGRLFLICWWVFIIVFIWILLWMKRCFFVNWSGCGFILMVWSGLILIGLILKLMLIFWMRFLLWDRC